MAQTKGGPKPGPASRDALHALNQGLPITGGNKRLSAAVRFGWVKKDKNGNYTLTAAGRKAIE